MKTDLYNSYVQNTVNMTVTKWIYRKNKLADIMVLLIYRTSTAIFYLQFKKNDLPFFCHTFFYDIILKG